MTRRKARAPEQAVTFLLVTILKKTPVNFAGLGASTEAGKGPGVSPGLCAGRGGSGGGEKPRAGGSLP